MKKIAKVSVLLVLCLSLLIPVSVAFATVPPPAYFTLVNSFYGSGAGRYAKCKTTPVYPGASYRPSVKCELQNNNGTQLDYQQDLGSYGASTASVTVYNYGGSTGRLVLWSTHEAWINSTYYYDYRVAENG